MDSSTLIPALFTGIFAVIALWRGWHLGYKAGWKEGREALPPKALQREEYF